MRKNVSERALQTPRSTKKEREVVFHALEQILLQPMLKTMVRQAVPLQPMEVHRGAEIHLQPVEDSMPEQGDAQTRLWPCGKPMLEPALGRICGPMESEAHTGAGLLEEFVTLWWNHTGAAYS
ncbi:protein pxr1-like [Pitangus sulphuratus]|nr:protein pxr1-like [Pitangus sulphuratus]